MRGQKRDRNESAIRARAEALGFLWLENNSSTKGRPDACLLRSGETYWCEVKVPNESFTPAQMDAFAAMGRVGVPVYVLETPDDVVRLLHGSLPRWYAAAVSVVRDAKGRQKKKREHRPGYDRARTISEGCRNPFCPTSRLPDRYDCAKHDTPREMATVENGLLPAPRKAHDADAQHRRYVEACERDGEKISATPPRKGVSGRWSIFRYMPLTSSRLRPRAS